MLLTTNRIRDFDDAIQSRIHLALRYNALGINTRRGIWDDFLKEAATAKGDAVYSTEELDDLARHVLNGRQIKNVVRAAHALAAQEAAQVTYSHLGTVIDLSKEFEIDFRGGQAANGQSYL
ncbi:hypothetical protein B0J14DRAFT_652786 [Halenospora varia]|nr:hypothetical protein B0J14DRAFT_652786 [Halenospora varia]